MSRNFMNEDFGSEEEDDDFNPVTAEDSDAEESKVGSSHLSIMVLVLMEWS